MNYSDLFLYVFLLFLKNLGLFAITGLKLKYVQMIHWINKTFLHWEALRRDDLFSFSAKMGELKMSDCQITPLLIMETSYNFIKIAVLIQQYNH